MKKNRALSALLAVMMVLSMMTCIALPAVAEGTVDLTKVPKVTTVTAAEDGAQEYKITEPSDFIHVSTYVAAFDINDVIYIANDIDINDYVSPTAGNTFADDFVEWGTGNSGKFFATLDGLNHTIYNWNANYAMIGSYNPKDGSIKNFTMVNPTTTFSGHFGMLVRQPDGYDNNGTSITFENIHIVGGTLNATVSGGYRAAFFFGGMNTDRNKAITVRNSSIVDSVINAKEVTQYVSLVGGLLKSGRPSFFENILLVNNTINAPVLDVGSSGFVVDRLNHTTKYDTAVSATNFKNIGVFNCTLNAGTGTYAQSAICADAYSAIPVNATNIFAAGNKKVTSSGTEAIKALFNDYAGNANLTISNYKVDNVAYESYRNDTTNVAVDANNVDADYAFLIEGISDLNTSADYADWGFDPNGKLVLLETGEKAPVAVTFNDGTAAATYYTDINGKLAVVADATKGFAAAKAGDIAVLAESTWAAVGSTDSANVTDWSQETFTADATYHKLTVTPNTVGDEHKHDIACAVCDDHDQSGVACTETADPESSAELGYFSKKTDAYKCDVCGNTWTVIDENGTYDAPYTVSFDDTKYANNGTTAKVSITPKTDANMSSMKVTLTYPADHLEYTGTAASNATYLVNNEADGTLILSLAANGTTLIATDALTLEFTLKGMSETVVTADLKVEATLNETTVGFGNDTAIKEALTKTASAEALALGVTFTPGDVNGDDAINLMDPVLTLQKLNNTIGSDFEAVYDLKAADVDNSGEVNTGDVVLLLQYVCEMDPELKICTHENVTIVTA